MLKYGNLADNPLVQKVDALYDRGWSDRHTKQDYDPRGTKEWADIYDLLYVVVQITKGVSDAAGLLEEELIAVLASTLDMLTEKNEFSVKSAATKCNKIIKRLQGEK